MIAIAAFELVAAGFGIVCVVVCRLERLGRHQGVILGVASGILFGICDI